jgi:glutaminyl-peptide cyclotransferase
MKPNKFIFSIISILVLLQISTSVISWRKISLFPANHIDEKRFDGSRALADVEYQVSLGPRIPGTQGHDQIISWMVDELESNRWLVEVQETEMLGNPIKNVIAKRNERVPDVRSWIILGAHFDTRIYADQDPNPEFHTHPVPGANDGASGVSVLLELARVLPVSMESEVWLVFFDAEDNGRIPGWDWILGSRAFVEELNGIPDAVVIVDMIGDKDLEIYMERGSDSELSAEIWEVAEELGYTQFIPTQKYHILDDHVPFLEAGIRAVDIIDFDYPYWHTTEDTVDKVSAESLEAVGETLRTWLHSNSP